VHPRPQIPAEIEEYRRRQYPRAQEVKAALDAVRQWRFSPTLLNGAPIEVLMNVTVHFSLPD
jgi:hypothetical protein